jgi:hypothetical protein
MRELLLAPRNLLRMKEAMLSVLAGDIFGSTPIWPSVRAFKLTYGCSRCCIRAAAPWLRGVAASTSGRSEAAMPGH